MFSNFKERMNLGFQHRCIETEGCSQGSSSGGYIGGAQGGDGDGHIAWPVIKLAGFQKQDPVPTCLCNWQVRWSSGWTIARRQQRVLIDRRSSCSRWSACWRAPANSKSSLSTSLGSKQQLGITWADILPGRIIFSPVIGFVILYRVVFLTGPP